MAHTHIMYDSDPHFTIDPDTRVLTYTSPEKLTIMQNDHNSEIITFDIPREIDGHDMLNCKDSVQVHFVNIDANNTMNRVAGVYNVTDLQVSVDDDTKLVCSWIVSSEATSLVGTLHFVLRFACMTGTKVEYAWHTSLYTGITILQTIDNTEVIASEYNDVLEEWYNELMSAGNTGVNLVAAAAQEAIDRIALSGGVIVSDTEPTSETVKLWIKPQSGDGCSLWVRNISTGVFEPIVTVAGDAGEPIHVVQETGDSQTNVMSQKAVSDQIYSINSILDEIRNRSITEIEDRLASTTWTANEALNKTDELIAEVDVVKSNNAAINGRIDFVEKDLEDLDTQVKTASSRVASIEGRVDLTDGNVTKINTKVARLDSTVSSLNTDMTAAKPFIDTFKYYIETLVMLRNDLYNYSDIATIMPDTNCYDFSNLNSDGGYELNFLNSSFAHESLVIPNTHEGKPVTSVSTMVDGNSNIRTIIIPSSVTTMKPDMVANGGIVRHMFEEMPNLERIDLLSCSVLPSVGSGKAGKYHNIAKDSPNCKIYITQEAYNSSWNSSGWNTLDEETISKIVIV